MDLVTQVRILAGLLSQMLHEEQKYVFEIARELGYELKLIRHERPTISCAEKLDLLKENSNFLDWTLDRMIKALYFSRDGYPFIGVITPEFGRNVKPKDIFPRDLISRGKAERYWVDSKHTPTGMSWGTCTPFPLVSSIGKGREISDLIIIDHPPINDKLVDISIGGTEKEMFEISMHLPYRTIYEILTQQFGNRIHLYQGSVT